MTTDRDGAPFYFGDPLFQLQTYMSGWVSHLATEEVSGSTKLLDLSSVWGDHRGRGVEVGVFGGEVDPLHPAPRARRVPARGPLSPGRRAIGG